MKAYFDPNEPLIIVQSLVFATGYMVVNLALDTGATQTMIDPLILCTVGYDLSLATDTLELATAGGVVNVPTILLERLELFGETRSDFPVTVHALPEGSVMQGLLGLDFFRGRVLKIDFVRGEIELT